jgi:cytochrome c biogenesis protein CcmG/thiol:disulfide interchange protein DsbE
MPRRPIVLALLVATLTTLAVIGLARMSGDPGLVDRPAPAIAGTTLDGDRRRPSTDGVDAGRRPSSSTSGAPAASRVATSSRCSNQGRPACREGLTVVGVLTDDPVEPARDFIAKYGATWPTVEDPSKTIKAAYRVAARPQTYFVDRAGVLRSIQVAELTDADFERQYARIAQ